MTLKVRFSVAFAAYTLLVLILFGSAYFVFERRAARAEQTAEQLRALEKIVSVCQAMHLGSSAVVVLNYINVLRQDPAVLAAGCLDMSNRVQASSDPQLLGKIMPDVPVAREGAAATTRPEGKLVADWFAPVIVRERRGTAYLSYDKSIIDGKIRDKLLTTLRQLILVGACAFLGALIIGVALAWSLSRPMLQLVEAARHWGEGDWDFETPAARRSDEVGFLAGELQLMGRKLKQLDALKNDFISSVSHDLRSPLAAIGMYAEYMLHGHPKKGELPPEFRDMLGVILYSATRLNVFITNILDTAKMRAGRMEYSLAPVDVAAVAANVASLYALAAAKQGQRFVNAVPAALPRVKADPVRFEHVLSNLVSNSLKFTRPGGDIRLSARPADGAVEICVADTGCGISPEDLPKLFERFRQFDAGARAAPSAKGTGLGLSIVKHSVEAMGGAIRVESEPGRGTKFFITLPSVGGTR
ncbi:MAG: HAMP domain-containing sensor histidine kinase [Elusimicrobiota bacterium]